MEQWEKKRKLDATSQLLYDAKQFPRLTEDETAELCKRAQAGDIDAKNRVVEANVRLCVKIADKMTGRGMDIDDMVQVGCIGLMRAVDLYQPDMGYRFSTYASAHIFSAIQRDIENNGRTVRIPAKWYENRMRYDKVSDLMEMLTGQIPSAAQVAEQLNVSAASVEHLISNTGANFSIEQNFMVDKASADGLGDTTQLCEWLIDPHADVEGAVMQAAMRDAVDAAIGTIKQKKQREVIRMVYGIDDGIKRSQRSLSDALGCTPQNVHLRTKAAMEKLRKPHVKRMLEDFLTA